MTGRELIVYILANHLENEDVFSDAFYRYLPTVGSVAKRFNVGVATVMTWIQNGCLDAIEAGDKTYILPDSLIKFTEKKQGEK